MSKFEPGRGGGRSPQKSRKYPIMMTSIFEGLDWTLNFFNPQMVTTESNLQPPNLITLPHIFIRFIAMYIRDLLRLLFSIMKISKFNTGDKVRAAD